MKKILFIVWSFSMGGGVEKVLSQVLNNIDVEKYDISVLEFHNFGIKEEIIPREIKILKPILKQYEGNNKFKTILNKLQIKIARIVSKYFPCILRKIYLKDKYDVEIACNYMIPTFLLSKSKSTKKICWVHEEILDYKDISSLIERIKGLENYRIQKRAFINSDAVVGISKRIYNSIVDNYPEIITKCNIINNGFDFENINLKSKEEIDFKVEDYIPIIVSIGRLDHNKNQRLLIDSVKILKEKGYKFRVLFIGEGENQELLHKYSKDLGLDEYITWKGYINNPYPYIRLSHILAITSYSEGFPTVAIEALTLGTALVSTDVAGINEITNGYEYCKISKRYPVEYAEKLEEVLLELGKNSHEKLLEDGKDYVKKFNIERQVKAFYELIEG